MPVAPGQRLQDVAIAGEHQSFGVDLDTTPFNGNEILFALEGSELVAQPSVTGLNYDIIDTYTAGDGWVTISIELGDYFAGNDINYLSIVNDDDGPAAADACSVVFSQST